MNRKKTVTIVVFLVLALIGTGCTVGPVAAKDADALRDMATYDMDRKNSWRAFAQAILVALMIAAMLLEGVHLLRPTVRQEKREVVEVKRARD